MGFKLRGWALMVDIHSQSKTHEEKQISPAISAKFRFNSPKSDEIRVNSAFFNSPLRIALFRNGRLGNRYNSPESCYNGRYLAPCIRAYDRAAIKFRGVDADINFTIADYEEDMNQMKNLSKEDFVQILRRQSTGFSRGNSRYRGVTLHKTGRWEARMGQFMGNKAYDKAAVTNFEPNPYEGQIPIMHTRKEDDAQKLDLNLGISITLDGPKGTYDRGVGESQTYPHPPLHFPNGKWPVNVNSANFPPGAPPLYGQPMQSRQSTAMWSGLPPGRSAPYEDKIGDQKMESLGTTTRLPNWAWYNQNEGQGGNGDGVGQPYTIAASSGFSSLSTPTSSTTYPFTNLHNNLHHQTHGR